MPRRCLLAMYYKQVIADRIGSRSPRHQAISAGYRKAAASLVTRFVVPPTLSQEDGAFRDDFLWLLWGLADFHLDTWYRVEVDNSVTFLFGDYAAAGMPLGSSSPGDLQAYLATSAGLNPMTSSSFWNPRTMDLLDDSIESETIDSDLCRRSDLVLLFRSRKERASIFDSSTSHEGVLH